MTEKEKMEHQKLYDANYDKELEAERIQCKSLCQKYNNLPMENIDERHTLLSGKLNDAPSIRLYGADSIRKEAKRHIV